MTNSGRVLEYSKTGVIFYSEKYLDVNPRKIKLGKEKEKAGTISETDWKRKDEGKTEIKKGKKCMQTGWKQRRKGCMKSTGGYWPWRCGRWCSWFGACPRGWCGAQSGGGTPGLHKSINHLNTVLKQIFIHQYWIVNFWKHCLLETLKS